MGDTTIYGYRGCSTCRKAEKFLEQEGIEATVVAIVDHPPTVETLRALVARAGLPLKRWFNTSGQSYRNGDFKNRLPEMSEDEALQALAADGKLIKRPVLVDDDAVFVGFKPDAWADWARNKS